jgi:FlaG/FlaF family flagellin (archaellin)
MDLDSVATAGGTGKALVVDVTQDAAKQLTDELNMIRKTITQTTTMSMVTTTKLACEYTIPANIMTGPNVAFDKEKVNVDFTSNKGVKQQVYRVDSIDKCTSTNALGWYYDDNTTPTKILLCPGACSSIQAPSADGGVDPTIAGSAPKVDVTLGCKSLYAPPA